MLFVRAALHDLAALHDDDLVGVANRAQPVRDDDARAAAAPQALVDVLLGVGSSALVASSRIMIVGSPTSDRAISSRWHWPPLKLPPPSCTVDW